MSDPHDPARRVAAAAGPLTPSPAVRARLLAAVAVTPQGEAAPARRPWWALSAAAAALAGVGLWLGAHERPAPPPEPPEQRAVARDPWEEPPGVAEQRAANEACWERERARLAKELPGQMVVIAHGQVVKASSGDRPPSPERRAGGAGGAGAPIVHAFTFRVGQDGPREAPFFSSWYAPRFAGAELAGVLGADWQMGAGGTRLTKTGKPERRGVGPVFPRLPFDLEGPPREPGAPGARLQGQEVFLGSLGPPLMLTPEDAVALDLFRWEVPGLVTVWGRLRCRQAVLSVGVSGWDDPHWVTALWPLEPRERLVDLARGRDRFWGWGGDLGAQAVAESPGLPGEERTWLLFGRDRVLGRAATPGELLLEVEADAEPTYHRFLMRWPREEALELEEAALAPPRTQRLGDLDLPARAFTGLNAEATWLVEAQDALRLRLERAEEGRDLLLRRADGTRAMLLGGWVRLPYDDVPPRRGKRAGRVVYVPPPAPGR